MTKVETRCALECVCEVVHILTDRHELRGPVGDDVRDVLRDVRVLRAQRCARAHLAQRRQRAAHLTRTVLSRTFRV